MPYHFRETAPEEQQKIISLLRNYGTITRNQFQFSRQLDLLHLLEAGDFRMTSLSSLPGDHVLLKEYAVWGDGWEDVVTFRVQTSRLREPDDGGWTTHVDFCEPEKTAGSLPDERLPAIREAVIWYEQIHYKLLPQAPQCDEFRNLAAVRQIMQQDRDFWRSKGIVLAEDYSFVVTTDDERVQLWRCIRDYGWSYFDYQNARVCIAMTDPSRTFLLTMSHYVSDGIKHCGEPDDYGYAVITPDTAGTVTVWFNGQTEIRQKSGKIPFSDEEIMRMTRFYDHYYHFWESKYRKTHGRLDEAAARGKAEKSLGECTE